MTQIRIHAAKYLSTKAYSQNKIAGLLQVSQPVISGYLKKITRTDHEIEGISDTAKKIGLDIGKLLEAKGEKGMIEGIRLGCQACKTIRQGGPACHLHRQLVEGLDGDCTQCLTPTSLIQIQSERHYILTELYNLIRYLVSVPSFNALIPQIGLQMISSTPNPETREEIAGFPGRIIRRWKGPPMYEAPVFGSSRSLSSLLLSLHNDNREISVIAAVKTSDWLIDRLTDQRLPFVKTEGFDYNKPGMADIDFRTFASFPLIIIDQGTIGYEAISYLICEDINQIRVLFDQILKTNVLRI